MKIHSIKHSAGVAGQYSLTAQVEYPGEGVSSVTFVGSYFGAPIVMVTESGLQTIVSRDVTERIGSKLTPEWIRGFFGLEA